MSNVIPFPRRLLSPWVYVGNERINESLLACSKCHLIYPMFSKKDFSKPMGFQPSLILVESHLKWSDPLDVVSHFSQVSEAPILFLLNKIKERRNDLLIRQAFGAGIFDVLYLPIHSAEAEDIFDLGLRVSKKVRSR